MKGFFLEEPSAGAGFEGFLLGLVQGLTEFLPVSSSGHLLLLERMFGERGEDSLGLILFLHGATFLSVLTVFFKDLKTLALSLKGKKQQRLLLQAGVSLLPLIAVGLFF